MASRTLSVDIVCRSVLAAWERCQPHWPFVFEGAEFTASSYAVMHAEQAPFDYTPVSINEWAAGHVLAPSVWRAYWIDRTAQQCLTLAGALLQTLKSLAERGVTHLVQEHCPSDQLDLASASLEELAIFPHKHGSVGYTPLEADEESIPFSPVQKEFLTTRIPRGGRGDDSWHCWVRITSTAGVEHAIDIACAQFDVFGTSGQPYIVLPRASYLRRMAVDSQPHPDPGHVTLPLVKAKIARMLEDLADFVEQVDALDCAYGQLDDTVSCVKPHEKGKGKDHTKQMMIPHGCPYGSWSNSLECERGRMHTPLCDDTLT